MEGIIQLKNGTDVRGVALDLNPEEPVTLTPEKVQRIAESFATWLIRKTKKNPSNLRIGIGRDSRLSGRQLQEAALAGIAQQGAIAINCGLASTPAMFMSTVMEKFQYDASIMITASHLPPNRNGMKFFTPAGGLEKTELTEVLQIAESEETLSIETEDKIESANIIENYAKVLVETIRKEVNAANYKAPLEGFKIVVDAGNGAGGFFVKQVLQPLGADTTGSCFLEPDGEFPNHIPNPELPEAMDALRKAVVQNNADLGISFDTDVDRAAAMDSEGNEINRNRLIALISAIVLEKYPKSWIVTDSITSTGLAKFITDLGGTHHRFKRGYKNVINESKRLNQEGNESCLAIETSGHGALKENYFLDDGAYLVACILIKMAKLNNEGKKLNDLIEALQEPVESKEFRFKIKQNDFATYGKNVISELIEYVNQTDEMELEEPNYEGVRINFGKENGDGWLLLRLSLHDPILPLNIESESESGVAMIAQTIYEFLKQFEELDLTSIENYLN